MRETAQTDGLRIRRGATVVGLDFYAPAIATPRALAAELGMPRRARFVEAGLYDAPEATAASRKLSTTGNHPIRVVAAGIRSSTGAIIGKPVE